MRFVSSAKLTRTRQLSEQSEVMQLRLMMYFLILQARVRQSSG